MKGISSTGSYGEPNFWWYKGKLNDLMKVLAFIYTTRAWLSRCIHIMEIKKTPYLKFQLSTYWDTISMEKTYSTQGSTSLNFFFIGIFTPLTLSCIQTGKYSVFDCFIFLFWSFPWKRNPPRAVKNAILWQICGF